MKNVLKLRRGFSLLALLGLSLLFHSVSAQNVADNIRPIGSICLAGQACVGAVSGARVEVSADASVTESDEPAVESVAEDTVEQAADAIPIEVAEVASDFDAAGAYQMSCNACHGTGAAGAPMLGDAGAWEARLEKGMDALMSNVINGVGAMPARGICMTCSDDDLQAIVNYMLAQN